MDLFGKCFGFPVSTTKAGALTAKIGGHLHRSEMERAEVASHDRTARPESVEPALAALRKLKRKHCVYVMLDDSRIGVQEGKRGRGAARRAKGAVDRGDRALRKLLTDERAKVARAAKRGKPGPRAQPKPAPTDDTESDFRAVRALLVFDAADLAGVSKGRCEILRRRVVAHVGTLDEWRKTVHLTLTETGVYVAEHVVVIADGGAGIWELIDELLPPSAHRKTTQALDWFHAASYVWSAARGLLIGSGAVESIHNWVIQARCRLPGMRWSVAGANAMLRLRSAWASGTWDEAFLWAAKDLEGRRIESG